MDVIPTAFGWLSGLRVCLSCGRSWYHAPALGKEFGSATCVKGRVVCGTVYGGKHYKDLLGSIADEAHCIRVSNFYLVVDDFQC